MQKYSSNTIDMFYYTKYSGSITGADVVVKNENLETKEVAKIFLIVKNNKIESCTFQAMGSVTLYATLTSVCELCEGKELSTINSITQKDVINQMKQLNKHELGEVTFAIQSFEKAVQTYIKRRDAGTLQQRKNIKQRNLHPAKNITVFSSEKRTSEIIENMFSEVLTTKTTSTKTTTTSEQTVVEPKIVGVKKAPTLTASASKQKQAEEKKTKTKSEQAKKTETKKLEKKEASKKTITETSESKVETQSSAVSTKTLYSKSNKATKKATESENSELMIKSVGNRKKQKPARVEVTAPTKIDVRVVDDDSQRTVSDTITRIIATETVKTTVNNQEIVNNTNSASAVITNSTTADDNMIDEIDSITEQLTNAISQLNFKFDETPEEEIVSKKKK